jgi:hypothetical protein
MLIYDICVRRNYEKNGEKKIKWYRVGFLKVAESGKKYIRLFQQPHTEFFVFNRKENLQGETLGSEQQETNQ